MTRGRAAGAHPHDVLPRGRAALYRTLLATHLISAVVNISAVFIVGQRIALDGSLTPLQAKVVSRAFVAAACWSPLFAAMAVVLHYVPGVDMLAVASTNLLFAALLVGWSAWALGRDPTVDGFVGYPLHREALVVLILAGVHPVISLAALASVMPASPREPDLIAMTALMAWSIGLGTSPFSGTTLALAGRFGMPATAFLRWNLPFLVVGLGGGCLLLGGLAVWRA